MVRQTHFELFVGNGIPYIGIWDGNFTYLWYTILIYARPRG